MAVKDDSYYFVRNFKFGRYRNLNNEKNEKANLGYYRNNGYER